MNICVPSKGRPNFKTAALLNEHSIPHTVFVEPQDYELYKAAGHQNIITLQKNDRGIGYSRQSILEYARSNGVDWFWMLDDDITGLFSYDSTVGKLVRSDPRVVLESALQAACEIPQLVIAGLDFRQFAWSHKGKSIYDTQVCACVLLNAEEGWFIKYPPHLMEDKAVCLDAIAAGHRTVRFTRWAFSTPSMGSGAGGCQSISDRAAAMKTAVAALHAKYGEAVIKPVFKKKLGWWDCRINWKAVRNQWAS